jgi:ankyrin repeat protein
VEDIVKIFDLYIVHLQRARGDLTNPHKRVFTLSFDGVICGGALLVGNDGRVHGVMPGKVPDLTKSEMDAIRGDPAIMREHLERFSEYAVGAMNIAAATSWAPDAPVFPVAAEPALTSAINEDHMKGFFKRVVTNVKAAFAIIAARPGGTALLEGAPRPWGGAPWSPAEDRIVAAAERDGAQKPALSKGPAHIPAKTWQSVVTKLQKQCGTNRTVIEVQARWFSLTSIDRSASRSAQPDPEAALFMASATGNRDAIRELITAFGTKVDAVDDGGRTPLFDASTCGQVEAVAVLLSLGASAQRSDADGVGPIHMAAQRGHGEVIRKLVATGASVAAPTRVDGSTPLHLACGQGHEAAVRVLVGAAGADLEARDESGETPFIWAAREGHVCVVQTLGVLGVDVTAPRLTARHR